MEDKEAFELEDDSWKDELPNRGKYKFIVNSRGHLKPSKKNKNQKTFRVAAKQCGNAGFSFTPVGYNCYAVKANTKINGVRKELGNTSANAYQFLRKNDNIERTSTSWTYNVKKGLKKDTMLDTMNKFGED